MVGGPGIRAVVLLHVEAQPLLLLRTTYLQQAHICDMIASRAYSTPADSAEVKEQMRQVCIMLQYVPLSHGLAMLARNLLPLSLQYYKGKLPRTFTSKGSR